MAAGAEGGRRRLRWSCNVPIVRTEHIFKNNSKCKNNMKTMQTQKVKAMPPERPRLHAKQNESQRLPRAIY
eukprot:10304392-Alexandrium_andersonii.AAC.1